MIFLPITALILLTVQKVLDIEFTSFEIQIITDGLLSLAVILGIMGSPHEPEE